MSVALPKKSDASQASSLAMASVGAKAFGRNIALHCFWHRYTLVEHLPV